jgi:hypothetical protein
MPKFVFRNAYLGLRPFVIGKAAKKFHAVLPSSARVIILLQFLQANKLHKMKSEV